MAYFAQPGMARDQRILLPNTLDDVIPSEHPIRILDEILREVDWTLWEARYHGRRGQPAMYMAPRHLVALSSVFAAMNTRFRLLGNANVQIVGHS